MTKVERWYSSIALIVGVLPAIIVALAQSFVTGEFLLPDAFTGDVHTFDFSQINFISIFCIVPAAFILIARFLRGKDIVGRHFFTMVTAILFLSVVFFVLIFYMLISTVRNLPISLVFRRIDYFSLICSTLCIVFCVLSNFLPQLPPNPVFGVKNSRTASSPEVWARVNSAAASALTYIFLTAAVVSAYTRGTLVLVVLFAAIIVYYAWVALYSRYAYSRHVRKKI